MERVESEVLSIEPLPDGTWTLRGGPDGPVSRHRSASEAELVALGQARSTGAKAILLRDRYGRVRTLPVRSAVGRFRP